MKRYLLFAFVILFLPQMIPAQIAIPNSPFLYMPAENYNDCENQNPASCYIDGVIPNSAHRSVPVRVRFPRNTTGRLPLVLWSHGGGANENGRTLNETWGRTLARAGYIVIHMSHRPWTPTERAAVCQEFNAATVEECQNLPMTAVYQPRDANVVLASLDLIEQNIPQLNNRIDRENISVAGWSGGSLTAMALAGARFRITNAANDVGFINPLPKAFLANSPQGPDYAGFKQDSWREIYRPVLTATGLGDATKGEDAPSRLVAFRVMPPTGKYQLYINHPGSTHDTFNIQNEDFPHFNQWIASYSLAYFDAYLKNRPAAQSYLISNRLSLYASRKIAVIYRK